MFLGCGDDDAPVDAGDPDTGAIRFDAQPMDSTPLDAPSTTDSGTDAGDDASAEQDTGPEISCTFSFGEGLSDDCFPACEEGSLAAVSRCRDYACLLDVMTTDESLPLSFTTGDLDDDYLIGRYLYEIVEAMTGCHQCETLVARACEYQVCPDESEAFFECLRTGEASCLSLSTAVYNCANSSANEPEFYSCYERGRNRCLQ